MSWAEGLEVEASKMLRAYVQIDEVGGSEGRDKEEFWKVESR